MKTKTIITTLTALLWAMNLQGQVSVPGSLVTVVLDEDGKTRCLNQSAGEFRQYVLGEPSGTVVTTRSVPHYGHGNVVESSATFVVTYNGFSAEAQTAFQFAVDIWASQINSPVDIRVTANWVPLAPNVLGSAGPGTGFRDFSGAPVPGVFYAVALAEMLAGTNLNFIGADINANFNSTFGWYLGTDGNPGSQYDFVDVVLHELCHGLGFVDSFDKNGTIGSWGITGIYPYAFDLKLVNGPGDSLLNTTLFPNPSAALGAVLTSNDVFNNGVYAVLANSGGRPRIYAPATWAPGSSIAHLDEATYPASDVNSLMTPQVGTGEATRTPGPITTGIFQDMGWAIASRILVTKILLDITLAEETTNFFIADLSGLFVDMFGSPVTTSVSSSGDVVPMVSNDSLFLSVTSGFVGTDVISVLGVNGENDSLVVSFEAKILAPNAAVSGVVYSLGLPGEFGSLYSIDPNTGLASLIAETGLRDGTALAIRPSTKEIYALVPRSGSAVFGKVDALTGEVAQIATIGISNLEGMTFDTNDDLYISARSGDLYELDPATGQPLLIGGTGISRPFGLAIDPTTGQLWGGSFQTKKIYHIDKTTGASSEVGNSGFSIRGMTFDETGKCYAMAGSNNSESDLIRLDTSTGLGTVVGTTGIEDLNSLGVDGTIVLGIETVAGPADFELFQNFPNPFNPVTQIRYSIEKRVHVLVAVYNTLGQRVAKLVDAVEDPGLKHVSWSGKTDSGVYASSGIYFYQIEAGGFAKARKMLLIK